MQKVDYTKTAKTQEDWTKWDVSRWKRYISERLHNRKNVYFNEQDELIANYNREQRLKSDYHGREILELLQNADDAGFVGQDNRVLIKYREDYLLVANTGKPFSPDGIKSLMISDRSPKQSEKEKTIGHKGLGFRSILGWTQSLLIIGKKVSIGFHEKIRKQWLEDLRKNVEFNVHLTELMKDTKISNPVPFLGVPYVVDSIDAIPDEKSKAIYIEGQRLLEEGYDTIVAIKLLRNENVHEQVKKQIRNLSAELMLFLNKITEINIDDLGKTTCWKTVRNADTITLITNDVEVNTYKLFSLNDKIPEELIEGDEKDKNYELKLAFPLKNQTRTYNNKLFVYFPTEVRFPLPFITHATFELAANRDHLLKNEVNHFIADKLAEFIPLCIETLVRPDEPWYALKMAAPQGDFDPILEEKFDFLNNYMKGLKNVSIIPVRKNKFRKSQDTQRIYGDFDNLLNHDIFGDLCLYTDDKHIKELLENLEIPFIEEEELSNRITSISPMLSLEDRVELLVQLLDNYYFRNTPSPKLLINETGDIIESDFPVFLPPEDKQLDIPSWVPIHILNNEMIDKLAEKWKLSNKRELVSKLKPSYKKVEVYSAAPIISAIVSAANKRIREKSDSEDELQIWKDAIAPLFSIYENSREELKTLQQDVKLPTRCGRIVSAKQLYFGKEYKCGKVLDELYGNMDEVFFVGSPQQLGLVNVNDEDKVASFLKWLGVSAKPRTIEVKLYKNHEFFQYVHSLLSYPVKFNDFNLRESEFCEYGNHIRAQTIEYLEEILKKAKPESIIAWLSEEERFIKWSNFKFNEDLLYGRPSFRHNYRMLKLKDLGIDSYILWQLQNIKWLPTTNNKLESPKKCAMIQKSRDISSIIGRPLLDDKYALFQELNVDNRKIKQVLMTLGVVFDFNDLSWELFYNVLLELPKIDPDGKMAKSIYRTLISRKVNSEPAGNEYNKFIQEGKMFGRQGGNFQYYPINQLYYIDQAVIPDVISNHFTILDLDKRRGSAKVEKLFGVKPLTREQLGLQLSYYQLHKDHEAFQEKMERMKPYIYALRVDEDTSSTILSQMKRMQIKLCKELKVQLIVNEQQVECSLKNGDSIIINNEAYIVMEENNDEPLKLSNVILADAVGEVISYLTRIDLTGDVARILSCDENHLYSLLDRITGGSAEERMKKARSCFEIEDNYEENETIYFEPLPPARQKFNEETSSSQNKKDTVLKKERNEETVDTDHKEPSLAIHSIEVSYAGTIKPENKTKVRLRIQRNVSAGDRIKSTEGLRMLHPDRSENLVFEFEKAQGRYPLMVSHIRGSEGYGCDIVSFDTEVNRTNFTKTNNAQLISRFIEVKGSKHEKGTIILKGNELKAAEKYKERYYLYRVYEKNGNFTIIEVNNPLRFDEKAIDVQYEINPFRSEKSKKWSISIIEDMESTS